jgi:cytochrome P450
MLSIDPPEHHRLRQVVSSGFTPRMIARLEEQIDARVDQLLEPVAGEECDFVEALAYPLPMHVIADIIGIPESDRSFVFERTKEALDALDPEAVPAEGGDGLDLYTYAMELAAAKRAKPADDVWSTIISSGLPDDDVALFFMVLSIAGSETTRNALSHGLLALLSGHRLLARIDDDPTLLGRTGTDEILRYTSPVLVFARDATTDIDIAGATIEEGDRVLMWYGVANRDPNVFADPDTLDLDRDPNPHVAFGGGGPHYCLGANLAKREITSMFTTLAARFGRAELTGEPVWGGPGPISNVGCSLTRLPVRLSPSD